MSEVIEIILNGTDRASAAIKGVSGELESLGKIAGGALTVGLGIASAAVGALGVGLGIAMKEAMDAEKVNARVAAVLKSTGGAAGVSAEMVDDLAMKFRDLAGGSDEAVKSAEAVLLRFQNIGVDIFPRVTETAMNLADMLGVDTTSAALMLGKALEDPGQGLLRLKAAGVVFTAEQVKMIKQMTDAGDAAGAQKYILDALTESTSGAAKAMGETFAGRLEIMKGHLLEIAETIGSKLLPIFEPLATAALKAIDAIAGRVQPFLNLIASGVSPLDAFRSMFVSLLPPDIQAAWDAIVGAFQNLQSINLASLIPPDVMAGITNLVSALVESAPQIQAAGDTLTTAMGDIATKIQTAWQNVAAAAGPEVIANIAAALNSMAELWRAHGADVIAAVTSFTATISSVMGTALSVLGGIVGAGLAVLTGTFAATMQMLQGNWSGAWATLQATGQAAVDAILAGLGTSQAQLATILGGWIAVVQAKLADIRATWQANFELLHTILITVLNNASTALVGKLNDMVTTIRGKATDMYNAGVAWMQGLINGIQSMVSKLIAAAVAAVQAAIDAAKKVAGISSPSAVFAGMGNQMMIGMAIGIQRAAYMPALATAGAVGGTISTVNHSLGTLNMSVSGTGDPGLTAAMVIRELQDRDLIRKF